MGEFENLNYKSDCLVSSDRKKSYVAKLVISVSSAIPYYLLCHILEDISHLWIISYITVERGVGGVLALGARAQRGAWAQKVGPQNF